ncbi:hypothetical protein SAMN04488527_1464 [Aliiroseovarius crassostreae]|uniref:Uncharacterized protein n=1 Tax=Aliiroseovarius crassostreae TaxID=154981 RepID=A0A0N8IC17_9RHOB|nr:hypothetical protein AKJ29_00950 [Aliiroseovarius crassostreae]SFU94361.1 hypothetical protein SAMN04488527_1464 [Aliiroseovarius crassostreae]
MSMKNRKAIRKRTRMSKIKDALAVLCILTFLWLVFFGNLLEREPNLQTIGVFVVCAVSFATLFFLRLLSFLVFLRGK